MNKLYIVIIILFISIVTYAQVNQGTPNQLRVRTDASGYLVLTAAAQTLPLSQPSLFSNTRLRTDANGRLLVTVFGGSPTIPSFPILATVASGTNCTSPPYSFTGDPDTGYCSSAANTSSIMSGGLESVRFGNPTGSSATSSYIYSNATLPSTLTAVLNAVSFIYSTAGTSNFSIRGLNVQLNAGYTGPSATNGLRITNTAGGTGQTSWVGLLGNYGVNNVVAAATIGHNVGQFASAASSSTLNIGLSGRAVSNVGSPPINIGVAGLAENAPAMIGGFFGLNINAPIIPAESVALVGDIGLVPNANILSLRNNGVTITSVISNGAVQLTEQTPPTAAPTNKVRIYSDDLAGKTRLCALFQSGVAQCFAVEP